MLLLLSSDGSAGNLSSPLPPFRRRPVESFDDVCPCGSQPQSKAEVNWGIFISSLHVETGNRTLVDPCGLAAAIHQWS
jgi:hypothetical protein